MPAGSGYDISQWVNGYNVLTLSGVSRDHIPNAMSRIIKLCAGVVKSCLATLQLSSSHQGQASQLLMCSCWQAHSLACAAFKLASHVPGQLGVNWTQTQDGSSTVLTGIVKESSVLEEVGCWPRSQSFWRITFLL